MVSRIVNWHISHNGESLPAFYMEQDYTPKKVRIYAGDAPITELEVDILDDGTSIFGNRAVTYREPHTVDSVILYGSLSADRFEEGERITGSSSGATAIAQENSKFGVLRVRLIRNTEFTAAETIIGGDSGVTATVSSFARGTDGFLTRVESARTTVSLPIGENLEPDAENYDGAPKTIVEGSVLTCDVVNMGGANRVTVQLELSSIDD